MLEIDSQTSVGQLVAMYPQLARMLEDLKIDYCCGGSRTVKASCEALGLDPQLVLEKLQAAVAAQQHPVERNWCERPLVELCDHIEQTHHVYLRHELPRLNELTAKVVQAHLERHPQLKEVQRVLSTLQAELDGHMMKEERVLFPAIRWMEVAEQPLDFPFGSVANPIRMMEDEHDGAAQALGRLRHLTADYQPPEDACNAYRAMLQGLQALDRDLHQHIHKENNILFPRAMELEMKPTMPLAPFQPLA